MTVLEELMESFDDYQRESQNESITIEKLKEVIKNDFLKKEKRQIKDFCNHLNTYKGLEEIRFDFMLSDFLNKKKVIFTGQELAKVIDYLQNKETISIKELQQNCNRSYEWSKQVMETLEELHIVQEFKGNKNRIILKTEL